MKKIIKIILIVACIVCITFFIVEKHYKNYNVTLKNEAVNWSISCKGLKEAEDFTFDDKDNCYIAFKDKIQYINKNGESYDLMEGNLCITSIEYYNGSLYYTSANKIYQFNLVNKNYKLLVDNIPNFGDYNRVVLKLKNGYLYAAIGSATNSGVVGQDNTWLKNNPYNYDITPKMLTLKGDSFDDRTTGAFVPYKTQNIKGQIIPEHFPGNSSIIICNIYTGEQQTYAFGIRNIEGLDFNSEAKLIAVIGGIEDRGLRPLKGDSDYIYEIKKDAWYGWPDYSGGDPVDSPKFKGLGNKPQSFILAKHPTTNPPSPIYQYKSLSVLGALTIDALNILGEKDGIYFYDKNENKICVLNRDYVLKDFAYFNSNSKLKSIKIIKDNMFVLDSSNGYMIKIERGVKESGYFDFIDNILYYYILISIIMIITAIILFINHNK